MIVTWSGHTPSRANEKKYGARAYDQSPIQMCQWIAKVLDWGIEHGWHPSYPVTSGYRPGVDSHTSSGVSNHQARDWNDGQTPCGAIDFGGYDSPEGKRTKEDLIARQDGKVKGVPRYRGKRRLMLPIGFDDDGHCSGNGH